MNYCLQDFNEWSSLRPLSLTRSVADVRIGILTIREKWELMLKTKTEIKTQNYLQPLYPISPNEKIIIRSSVLPNENLIQRIQNLKKGDAIYQNELLIACFPKNGISSAENESFNKINFTEEIINIQYPWDIFAKNHIALQNDFAILTTNKKSQPISSSNKVIGNNPIFLEEGAKCECSILNATDGPIYIGKNAEIMEGSMVRGPFALCDNAQLKMGTKIYGATTIGPFCKVGGEVTNSVIFGYSNKAHDGFLGNSVLGEWCNLGADTNNSNLKNNYGSVKVYSYASRDMMNTNLQFCGLIMGDHSKSGINTMFNTGTMTGVSANIFGGGFPAKFIPSFSWGGSTGFVDFELEKAFDVMEKVMERRNKSLSPEMKKVMTEIFHQEKSSE